MALWLRPTGYCLHRTVVILALTAIIMLAEGVWSPTGGLLAVAAITAACLVAQVPAVRRGVAAQAASGRAAARYLAARAGRGAAPDEPTSEFPATSAPEALAAAGYGTTGPVGAGGTTVTASPVPRGPEPPVVTAIAAGGVSGAAVVATTCVRRGGGAGGRATW